MEAGKLSIQESVMLARELKVIHVDRKKGNTVNAIENNNQTNEDNIEDEEFLTATRDCRRPLNLQDEATGAARMEDSQMEVPPMGNSQAMPIL